MNRSRPPQNPPTLPPPPAPPAVTLTIMGVELRMEEGETRAAFAARIGQEIAEHMLEGKYAQRIAGAVYRLGKNLTPARVKRAIKGVIGSRCSRRIVT